MIRLSDKVKADLTAYMKREEINTYSDAVNQLLQLEKFCKSLIDLAERNNELIENHIKFTENKLEELLSLNIKQFEEIKNKMRQK